jgi:hypothetical protein
MKALTIAAAAFVAVIGSAHAESGVASHYSTRELGTRTASGRSLHDRALTAAQRTLSLVLYASSSVRVSEHLRLPYCLSGIFQLLNQTSLPGKFLNRI